jgi:hypothetical protein
MQDVGLSMAAGGLLGGPVNALPVALNRLPGALVNLTDRTARSADQVDPGQPGPITVAPTATVPQELPDSGVASAAPLEEPAAGPIAVFRGPRGEEYEASLGEASLDQVKELMFRTHPGVEFVGVKGKTEAGLQPIGAPIAHRVTAALRSVDQETPTSQQSQVDAGEPPAASGEPREWNRETYSQQVTTILDGGGLGGPMIALGRPSAALQEAGVPDQPVQMAEGVVRKITAGKDAEHRLSREQLLDLPRALHDPIMVFSHPNGNTGILTELVVAGRPALVGLRIQEQTERGPRITAIATVYGKRLDSIANWVESGRLRWWNKTKTEAWLRSNGAPIAHRMAAALRSREPAGNFPDDAPRSSAPRDPQTGPQAIDTISAGLEQAGVPAPPQEEGLRAPFNTGALPAGGQRTGGAGAVMRLLRDVMNVKSASLPAQAATLSDPQDPQRPSQAHEPAGAFLNEGAPPASAELAADEAEARAKAALGPKPKGMHIPERPGSPGEAGFINPGVLADLVVAGARLLRRLGGAAVTRTRWAAAMAQTFGARVGRYLGAVWDQIARIGTGVARRLSPAALGHRNQVEELAGRTNTPPEERPLYDPAAMGQLRSRLLGLAPPSTQMRILGGQELLQAKQQLDLVEATQAAAVRRQADALRDQVINSAQRAHPSGWALPRWLVGTRRARHFMNRALHIAARLNPVGRDANGRFIWSGFEQRMGSMTPRMFASGRHSIGDQITWTHPVLGTTETVTIGPLVRNADGRPVHQLTREIPPNVQEELYDAYRQEYPDMIWFLDMFIDPALAGTRVNRNGIEIPVFNRMALAAMMAEGHPEFAALEAYTPDVLVTRSLLGAIRGAFQPGAGSRSPGRRYKTGASRESGNVRDLLSGFNIRTVQMLREQARARWAQALLNSARPLPRSGVEPEGWVKLESGMNQLWTALQRLRAWRSPIDPATGTPAFPETERRMSDDQSPEWRAFFGEAARLRGRQLMLPERLVENLTKRMAAEEQHSLLFRLGEWAVRNSTRLLLAAPNTYAANVAINDLFTLEAATRRIISGVLAGDPRDLRFARQLLLGEIAGRFIGLRESMGLGRNTQFMRTVREILPDEIFAGSTGLADLAVRFDETPGAALRSGEIGAAALQLMRYGNIDVRAKQRMAYAWLRAQAVTNARRAGLRGPALRAAVERYLINPPMEDRAQAVAISNFELLNLADSPAFVESLARSRLLGDYGKLFMPFPRFGYHYIAKNAARASAVRDLISRVPRQRRADALADVLTFLMYPAGGLGIVGAAALRSLGGGDDEDAQMLFGTSRVKSIDREGNVQSKPLDRSLVTVNRMNLSAWARALGLGSEQGDEDFWLRVRNYPMIAMAGAALLAEQDARKFGAKEGALTYLRSALDLASDFFSVGMAAKVPDKVVQSLRDNTQGRNPPAMLVDPYGARVPFSAYVTDQTLDSFVPGSRQADIAIRWLDPVPRRKTAHRGLGFQPGVWDAARAGHLTGLLDRLFAGEGGRSTLPAEGPVSRLGRIDAQEISRTQRLAELGGLNIRPINRQRYSAALAE